jgi:hypothetical protein
MSSSISHTPSNSPCLWGYSWPSFGRFQPDLGSILAPMANCESPKCGFLHFSTFQVLAGVHLAPSLGSLSDIEGNPRKIPGQRHEAEGGQNCGQMYGQKVVRKGVQKAPRNRKSPVKQANPSPRKVQKRVKNGPQKRHQKSRAEIHPRIHLKLTTKRAKTRLYDSRRQVQKSAKLKTRETKG